MGAEVEQVGPLGQGRVRRELIHPFLHREALAGKGRLIHAEVALLDQAAIAGNAVTGSQPHPITPHHLSHRNRHLHPIPPDRTTQFHHRQQLLHGALGAVLLPEAQQTAHQHNHQDDQAVGGGVEPEGEQRRPQQHQDDRAGELAQQQGHRRCGPGSTNAGQGTTAGGEQPGGGFRAGEALGSTAESLQQGLQRFAPVGIPRGRTTRGRRDAMGGRRGLSRRRPGGGGQRGHGRAPGKTWQPPS